MKRWPYVPEPKQAVIEVPPVASVTIECMNCMNQATILYLGTSYCRTCLTEKLRQGR